jgi:hypothetical protein
MTKQNAIVIGRLLFVGILIVIKWAIFQPIYFISTILSTMSEVAINGFNAIINNIQKINNELLTKDKQ